MKQKMCSEFTNIIRRSDLLYKMENYLPELIKWFNETLAFWNTDLLPKPTKKCFNVSSEILVEGVLKKRVKFLIRIISFVWVILIREALISKVTMGQA